MKFKIGFTADNLTENVIVPVNHQQEKTMPRKSVVDIHFQNFHKVLSYYNDQFDLQCGDLVYVEGKLEGQIGCVVSVNYNFKIRRSDYKRVISVADTNVSGEFFMSESMFITFDRNTLPCSKVVTWFKAPSDDEFVTGGDNTVFALDDISSMNVSSEIAQRGYDYYMNNKVRYLCIDGTKGYAIVEGSNNYEVEFEYNNRDISNLICSCFCSYNCKHEVATMLQLKETLEIIEKNYADKFKESNYFSAVNKATMFSYVVGRKSNGKISL